MVSKGAPLHCGQNRLSSATRHVWFIFWSLFYDNHVAHASIAGESGKKYAPSILAGFKNASYGYLNLNTFL